MEDLTMHVGQSPVDSVVSEGEAVMMVPFSETHHE